MEFDLFTILPLAVALFVFWKLRSVLGTRNGNEKPPYEPYIGNDAANDDEDNVVTLPGATRRRGFEDDTNPAEAAIAEIAGKDKDLKHSNNCEGDVACFGIF